MNIEDGRFWIEVENDEYTVNLAASSILGSSAKKALESAAHNREYMGLGGLFRKAVDSMTQMFRDSGANMDLTNEVDSALAGIEYRTQDELLWSLDKYSESLARDEKAESWDQLELSVLKKYSKDIIISYRNNRIDIRVIADI